MRAQPKSARRECAASTPSPEILVDILANKWSLLILAEACRGTTRFNRFEERLGITPKSLSRCLAILVEAGLLAHRSGADSPARGEYLLTDEGKSIRPALASLSTWVDQHLPSAIAESRDIR